MATAGPTNGASGLPYGGSVLVVDTSAWVVVTKALRRDPRPDLLDEFFGALRNGQLRGSTVVKLELLHSARDPTEFTTAEERLDAIPTLPITAAASEAAVGALRDLSEQATAGNPANHRVGHGDVLVTATAWATPSVDGVLHYDEHFEKLAPVLGVEQVWIADRGDY